jgi:hypothetical protein
VAVSANRAARRCSRVCVQSVPDSCAARSMKPATSAGCESKTTWLEGIVIDFAFISCASASSSFGEMTRSSLAITNQDGLFLHAGVLIGVPNAAPAVGACVAIKTHIRPMFVLFDSCWESTPKLGPQHPPIPGVHNSGWVQSPGEPALQDSSQYPRLKAYVEGVVGAFANDKRIVAWDVWNEPAGSKEVIALLPQVFEWAREAHPSQPLTSGIFQDNFTPGDKPTPVTAIQIAESDVISFHNYSWPENFEKEVTGLEQYHRPLLCSEYMARSMGSTFDTILPVAKTHRVAAINWGFVAGKSQTYLPWDSWDRPYMKTQPPVWFHDVLHADGTPYRKREAQILRDLTGKGLGKTLTNQWHRASPRAIAEVQAR